MVDGDYHEVCTVSESQRDGLRTRRRVVETVTCSGAGRSWLMNAWLAELVCAVGRKKQYGRGMYPREIGGSRVEGRY